VTHRTPLPSFYNLSHNISTTLCICCFSPAPTNSPNSPVLCQVAHCYLGSTLYTAYTLNAHNPPGFSTLNPKHKP